MIVLKKINSRIVEKIIHPGQTESFFNISLDEYDSFDWGIKTLGGSNKGTTKISSLFNDGIMESTVYAYLGKRFKTVVSIFVFNDDHCRLEITNNESSLVKCIIKLKTF